LTFLLVALAAAPFSHVSHLKLKPACADCHRSAAASTRAEDNNLPSAKACQPCHRQAEIRAPGPRLVARFNHQLHLRLGNPAPLLARAMDSGRYLSDAGRVRHLLSGVRNACEACHRPDGEPGFPLMADCLVCHDQIDPPFSCERCHARGAALKPATHTPDFLDSHPKSRLDKTTCAVCHGRRFTCLGCH